MEKKVIKQKLVYVVLCCCFVAREISKNKDIKYRIHQHNTQQKNKNIVKQIKNKHEKSLF